MSVIDVRPLIAKYEAGEPMTPDEKELLLAALYFCYRQSSPALPPQSSNPPRIDDLDKAPGPGESGGKE